MYILTDLLAIECIVGLSMQFSHFTVMRVRIFFIIIIIIGGFVVVDVTKILLSRTNILL